MLLAKIRLTYRRELLIEAQNRFLLQYRQSYDLPLNSNSTHPLQ